MLAINSFCLIKKKIIFRDRCNKHKHLTLYKINEKIGPGKSAIECFVPQGK